jgi:regulator of protease activity HflC (stomatin/prohibitin superfamily)
MDIPAQEVITKDNVTVRVNAVAYFRVVDPNAAVVNIADYIRGTSQIAQTTLRSTLGQSTLDDLLTEREHINEQLQIIIDQQTEPWGIKVSVVEVKDVELPQSMQRAMARQAEAEREKRAKIIHAEGEFQASQQLAEAAQVIDQNPVTIQLRYLQTLTEIGAEKNTTIVFPLPIDLIGQLFVNGDNGRAAPAPAPTRPVQPPRSPLTPPTPTPLSQPAEPRAANE